MKSLRGRRKNRFWGVADLSSEKEEVKSKKVEFPLVHRSKRRQSVNWRSRRWAIRQRHSAACHQKNKDFELVGIASSGGLHAQHSGKKFGFQYATSSEDEIINDPNINTVAILTRHDSHADLVVKALKAGKHVFVEKPLAINSAQLSAISKQLKANSQSLLTVGFNRRFSPLAQHLHLVTRYVAMNQCTSTTESTLATFPSTTGLKTRTSAADGSSAKACHFMDLITFLVGAAPVSVTAHALPDQRQIPRRQRLHDLHLPRWLHRRRGLSCQRRQILPKERLEVFCEGMIAVLDDFVSLNTVKDGKKKEESGAQDKGWKDEMESLCQVHPRRGEPPIPYEQLIGVTKSTFAAVESIRKRQSIDI